MSTKMFSYQCLRFLQADSALPATGITTCLPTYLPTWVSTALSAGISATLYRELLQFADNAFVLQVLDCASNIDFT